jgi:uncharacterized membrane protein YeaQ/YmgE (transglycosylase-associated protein family)
MTDIFFWILFGILAGWIASIITDTHSRQRVLAYLTIGILGAMIGGALMRYISERGIAGFSIPSLLTALCGAIIFITMLRTADRGR